MSSADALAGRADPVAPLVELAELAIRLRGLLLAGVALCPVATDPAQDYLVIEAADAAASAHDRLTEAVAALPDSDESRCVRVWGHAAMSAYCYRQRPYEAAELHGWALVGALPAACGPAAVLELAQLVRDGDHAAGVRRRGPIAAGLRAARSARGTGRARAWVATTAAAEALFPRARPTSAVADWDRRGVVVDERALAWRLRCEALELLGEHHRLPHDPRARRAALALAPWLHDTADALASRGHNPDELAEEIREWRRRRRYHRVQHTAWADVRPAVGGDQRPGRCR